MNKNDKNTNIQELKETPLEFRDKSNLLFFFFIIFSIFLITLIRGEISIIFFLSIFFIILFYYFIGFPKKEKVSIFRRKGFILFIVLLVILLMILLIETFFIPSASKIYYSFVRIYRQIFTIISFVTFNTIFYEYYKNYNNKLIWKALFPITIIIFLIFSFYIILGLFWFGGPINFISEVSPFYVWGFLSISLVLFLNTLKLKK